MYQDVKVGFLAPLSAPGWLDAGALLVAGFKLGVSDINSRGGLNGRMIVPLVRDTAGNAELAAELATSLKREGVQVLAGEYHSVVARSVARVAHELELPYLCTSAVLDKLLDFPSNWVARLSPPQSKGWSAYAEFLCDQGHSNISAIYSNSIYWHCGMEILRSRIEQRGGNLIALPHGDSSVAEIERMVIDQGTTCLLLLLGHPQPVTSIVRSVRSRMSRIPASDLLIGTPAGQSDLPLWHDELGPLGTRVPFLQYLPEALTPLGQQTVKTLQTSSDTPASFVSLEGFDSALAIASLICSPKTENPWSSVSTKGTRGIISFEYDPGGNVWQWQTAPVRIAEVVGGTSHRREVRPLTKAVT